MGEILRELRNCVLFSDIDEKDIPVMLKCMQAKSREAKKGELILREGDDADYIGIVLSGAVRITRTDYYGNRSVISDVGPFQMFGEAFACSALQKLPVDVTALLDSRILLINAQRIVHICNNACSFHNQMIFNLLQTVAAKNIMMSQKIDVTSRRSTREKLMAYLLLQAKKTGSDSFEIPFDRQALADYLEVDRSGLSAEIGKLKKEGVLDCHKSRFRLL